MDKSDLILQKLESIEQTQEETQQTVNKISIRQKRVESKILGDKEFRTPGIIDDIHEAKTEIKNIKDYIAEKEIKEKEKKAESKGIKKGAVVGYSAAGAGGLYGIIEAIKAFFT